MAHANYTVSTHISTESTGDSVSGGTLPGTVTLVINPDMGYVASASDFFIGDPLPPEVISVSFSDSTTAGQPGNVVNVLVTLANNFSMPSADKELLIDIDGFVTRKINVSSDVTMCITDNVVSEGFCSDTTWPKGIVTDSLNSLSISNPSVTTFCQGQFQDVTEGSGITTTSGTNLNWNNPLLNGPNGQTLWMSLYGTVAGADSADTTSHSGSVSPNVTSTIFTKTFWTGPWSAFHPLAIPFYALNQAASSSGYYTIEETTTDYNVTKTVQTTDSGSNTIYCDTTDVYPGMQVIAVSNPPIFSSGNASDQNTYPNTGIQNYFENDVRVVGVDRVNHKVTLSETHLGVTVGDTINFSSIWVYSYTNPVSGILYTPEDNYCLTKTFTVKYNAPSTSISCEDGHEIDFSMYGGGEILQINGQPTGEAPKIVKVDIDTSSISSEGETRSLNIHSSGETQFNLAVLRSDGKFYNFTTEIFSSGSSLTNQTGTSSEVYNKTIVFPSTTSDYSYELTIIPSGGDTNTQTTLGNGVDSSYTFNQHVDTTITFASDATTTGLTLSSFSSPAAMSAESGKTWGQGIAVATWTGTVTKSGGEVLYYDGTAESATRTSAGSFTNATANDGEMELHVSITGSGTTTLTVTVVGWVFKQPTSNTTVTLDFDGFLGSKIVVPAVTNGLDDILLDFRGHATQSLTNVKERGAITCAAGGTVNISLKDYDYDANKALKDTYEVVQAPADYGGGGGSGRREVGTVGEISSGGVVEFTANNGITSSDIGKIISFTYKGKIGAGSFSHAKPVYILIDR